MKGTRAELERRISEFKTKLDAGEAILRLAFPDARARVAVGGVGAVSTPERRDGRKRRPHRGNSVVTWPAVAPFPGGDANTSDPLTQSDPWRGWASQRSHIVHSGMSPKLERER